MVCGMLLLLQRIRFGFRATRAPEIGSRRMGRADALPFLCPALLEILKSLTPEWVVVETQRDTLPAIPKAAALDHSHYNMQQISTFFYQS
jgi:hypothetical protein